MSDEAAPPPGGEARRRRRRRRRGGGHDGGDATAGEAATEESGSTDGADDGVADGATGGGVDRPSEREPAAAGAQPAPAATKAPPRDARPGRDRSGRNARPEPRPPQRPDRGLPRGPRPEGRQPAAAAPSLGDADVDGTAAPARADAAPDRGAEGRRGERPRDGRRERRGRDQGRPDAAQGRSSAPEGQADGGRRAGGRPPAGQGNRRDGSAGATAGEPGGLEPANDRSNDRGNERNVAAASTGSPALLRSPRGHEASWDADDDDAPSSAEPKVDWGRDDDSPALAISLPAALPAELADDLDPVSYDLEHTDSRTPRGDVMAVVGVRFGAAGRVTLFEAPQGWYGAGDQIVVDTDRGPRVGTVAVASERRISTERGLRRVLRHATPADLERETPGAERARAALRIAKDRTAALGLPVKVFRAELVGGRNDRLTLYITTEERVDLRELVRDLSSATSARVELRQLGARDEAKAVGGIGSCGLTLCCTTWLPEFVPVSIKMAKDQGLVLNPTKVAGQCGRLKCCLVYEQAGYAELRKGLPKLGKRVVTGRGEGRVVEVDVLRQRVRVSYAPGESEVLVAAEVKPLFPSGNPAGGRAPGAGATSGADAPDDPDVHDGDDDLDGDDDRAALAGAAAGPAPAADAFSEDVPPDADDLG
jgi:cell fate regulator YaaT (PSP1 superfamily)